MLDKPGVTESLARFVVATRWEDIPSEVAHQAKRSLMNFFAVALAGCRTSPVEMALRSLADFSGGKQATLIGRRECIDALLAAIGSNTDVTFSDVNGKEHIVPVVW